VRCHCTSDRYIPVRPVGVSLPRACKMQYSVHGAGPIGHASIMPLVVSSSWSSIMALVMPVHPPRWECSCPVDGPSTSGCFCPHDGLGAFSVDAGGIQAHLVPGKMALLVVSIGLRVLEPASRMRSVTVQTLVAVGPKGESLPPG
jgi:hypothetical protein